MARTITPVTATSANWKVMARAWRTTRAPILISFSLGCRVRACTHRPRPTRADGACKNAPCSTLSKSEAYTKSSVYFEQSTWIKMSSTALDPLQINRSDVAAFDYRFFSTWKAKFRHSYQDLNRQLLELI